MEHQLWKEIVRVLDEIGKGRKRPRETYSDRRIVEIWYWSVLHDRPVSWGRQQNNWPIYWRRDGFPSSSRMSRRLRSASVRRLLAEMEQRVIAPRQPSLYWIIDGKPLVISGCSKDRQAGYGRATGGKAKGYKIHAIVGTDNSVAAWRLAPMNKDERVMAARMLRKAPIQGYVVADTNYDSNPLHQVCMARGELQLVTQRRYGPGHGFGHAKQSAGRLRSMELVENPHPYFAEGLLKERSQIERFYGQCTNWWGGLSGLPAWARTYHRVHRWVQSKLVLTGLKNRLRNKTYAA